MSRPRKGAYLLGLGICLAATLVAELALGRLTKGQVPPGTLRGLGSLFTGLTLVIGILAWRALRRNLPPPPPMDLPMLSWLLPMVLPIAFGIVLWQNGAAHAETARHARIFVLLPPVMFFALVPRPRA